MIQPLPPPVNGDASLPYDISNLRNYSLAVSGDVFRWVIEYGNAKVLEGVSLPMTVLLPRSLKFGRYLLEVRSSLGCLQMRNMSW